MPNPTVALEVLGDELTREGEKGKIVKLVSKRGKRTIPFSCESEGIRRIVSFLNLLILMYPCEAVREILSNAFTHRDWLSNASVQIDIYHDAVEICNPGWFIEGQDPAEHLAGNGGSSLSRNMLIARTIYRCGDVEAYGSGIPRVRDLCVGAGIHIEYVRTSWGTKFIFHRNDAFGESNGTDGTENGTDGTENGTENSAMQSQDKDLESFVLDLLSKDPTMTVNKLSKKTGKSRRQVLRMLSSLRKGGKLERIGPNGGGQWHVLV